MNAGARWTGGSWWISHVDGKLHCTDYASRRPPGVTSGPHAYLCGVEHHSGYDGVLAVVVGGIIAGANGSGDSRACPTCVRINAEHHGE